MRTMLIRAISSSLALGQIPPIGWGPIQPRDWGQPKESTPPAVLRRTPRVRRPCPPIFWSMQTITIPKKDKPDSRPAAPRAASFKTSVNHHMNGESLSPYKQPPQLER